MPSFKDGGFSLSDADMDKVKNVIRQARESFKAMGGFVAAERRNLTNERILAGLKSLGMTTKSEMEAMEKRVSDLERKVRDLQSRMKTTPPA